MSSYWLNYFIIVTTPSLYVLIWAVSLSVCTGFPKTLSCSLFNSSYVPMTFALRVLGDGLGSPSVTWEQLSNGSKHNWQVSAARDLYARPAEFTIRPATGSVRSMSDITIKVTVETSFLKQILSNLKAWKPFDQYSIQYVCVICTGDAVCQYSEEIQVGTGGGCWGCRRRNPDSAYQCQVRHTYSHKHVQICSYIHGSSFVASSKLQNIKYFKFVH